MYIIDTKYNYIDNYDGLFLLTYFPLFDNHTSSLT